jgi:hypothetical protein
MTRAARAVLLAIVAGCAPSAPIATLTPGWNVMLPGGETVCSDGSPYKFFVRPGDPARVLLYFAGGGNCSSAESCDPHPFAKYKANAQYDGPPASNGIFDFERAENPFREYSVVYVSYCTGDVHIGDRVSVYDVPARADHAAHSLTIHHKGSVNVRTVLAWTYRAFPSPQRIFVAGSSAGAVFSPYYAWQIADHYPRARVGQLGDAAGASRRSPDVASRSSESWGSRAVLEREPQLARAEGPPPPAEELYIVAGQAHPEIAFAQYDAASDPLQSGSLPMIDGRRLEVLAVLDESQARIRAKLPTFRSYIAAGAFHTILDRPEFYSLTSGGVRIRDWVADLAELRAVSDIRCEACPRSAVFP